MSSAPRARSPAPITRAMTDDAPMPMPRTAAFSDITNGNVKAIAASSAVPTDPEIDRFDQLGDRHRQEAHDHVRGQPHHVPRDRTFGESDDARRGGTWRLSSLDVVPEMLSAPYGSSAARGWVTLRSRNNAMMSVNWRPNSGNASNACGAPS